eukprot:5129097-Pyramimonas_sp.AAC.1
MPVCLVALIAPSHPTEEPSSPQLMTAQPVCGPLATGPACAPSQDTLPLCFVAPSHPTEVASSSPRTSYHGTVRVWADGIDHHNDGANDDDDTSGDGDS